MQISVVLKTGKERLVSKDELQFLMATGQILFFERAGGWVVIGRNRDKFRHKKRFYPGADRRQQTVLPKETWY